VRSPAITSLRSVTLDGRPTLSGTIANGNSTVLRTGMTGAMRAAGAGGASGEPGGADGSKGTGPEPRSGMPGRAFAGTMIARAEGGADDMCAVTSFRRGRLPAAFCARVPRGRGVLPGFFLDRRSATALLLDRDLARRRGGDALQLDLEHAVAIT